MARRAGSEILTILTYLRRLRSVVMSVRVGRAALAAACLFGLAACATTSSSDNPFVKLGDAPHSGSGGSDDTTGSIVKPPPDLYSNAPATPELLGSDPNDDLSIGKKYFRQGSYGLAERHFRKAVELHPQDAESWLGLAAAYDRLHRFDLADRAYGEVIKIIGQTPEVLNNQGFSYMLRGDYRRARATLLAARAKDPKSPYIANNLRLLDASERKAKAVN
jgi:tetratricopeptide (TPR) repeat protein